jgi:hypothetical protein
MQATQPLLLPAPRPRARALYEHLVELDFTQAFAFAVLAVAFVASRVAWLDRGYGSDPDAWRVALTGRYFWTEGSYFPSRLPGYPLHELVTTLLVRDRWLVEPWVWTNLSTVFVSLAGVYLFAQLARDLNVPNKGVLTLGFAFAPLLWLNSVMTMDYMWALTFILGAYLALVRKQARWAGVLLGIAAGFRLTSLFMFVPFALLLWRTERRSEIRPVLTSALAVTLVAYLLVLMEYGIKFLNFYDQDVALADFVKRLGKDGLGIVGALALLGALALALPRLRAFAGDVTRDAHVLVWASAIVIFFLTYLRLPHEIAYLIPLFPFGYLLLARYLTRGLLVASLSVIVLAGFVDVTSPDDSPGISASTFTSARVGRGMLLSYLETVDAQMDFARELRRVSITNRNVETPAVIATGFIYPQLVLLYEGDLTLDIIEKDHDAISQLSDRGLAKDEERGIYYVWLLKLEEVEFFLDEGRAYYLTADAVRGTYHVYGYRAGYFNGFELPLSRDDPSIAAGTAATDR